MRSWKVTLTSCPYCKSDLGVSSLTTRSEKESIMNVIEMSKIHLDICRGGVPNKILSDITIEESFKDELGNETSHFKWDKILS